MKVTDLLGKTTNWRLKGHMAGEGHRVTSAPHKAARAVIRGMFPTISFKEEVPISTGRGTLYLDFYLPIYKLAIEVHGQQHYQYTPHFHHTRAGFLASKQRDRDKVLWCEINGLTIVELPYNEEEDDWKQRIYNAYYGQDE